MKVFGAGMGWEFKIFTNIYIYLVVFSPQSYFCCLFATTIYGALLLPQSVTLSNPSSP